jgi:hypothetical protein
LREDHAQAFDLAHVRADQLSPLGRNSRYAQAAAMLKRDLA